MTKNHWFAYSFIGKVDSKEARGSVYVGYNNKLITRARINEAKKGSGLDSAAVLMAVSYLGRMTEQEMCSPEDE